MSVRGALALSKVAMAWAISRGRTYVLPDDVAQLAVATFAHRMVLEPRPSSTASPAEQVINQILLDVPAPEGERPGMTNETTTGRSAPTGTGTTGRTGTGSWSRTARPSRGGPGVPAWSNPVSRAAGEAASRFAGWARRTYRVLAETVTPVGWLLVVGLVVGLLAGAVLGLIEGWVIAIAAGILLVLSLPFLLGGATFDVRLDIERNRVIAGTDVTGSLVATNLSQRFSLPGTIDVPVGEGLVEVPVPFLGKGSQHVEPVAIAARHRGVIQVGPMTITHGDPVGVLHRRSSWPQIETIYVHPRTVAIPSTSAGFIKDVEGTPTTTLVDSDLAFHAIREYQPGDSRRHVHWKSTAKTGKLMVRQYEETRRASLAVVLDSPPRSTPTTTSSSSP